MPATARAHEGGRRRVDLVGVQVVAHDDVGDAERVEAAGQALLRPRVRDRLLDRVEQPEGARRAPRSPARGPAMATGPAPGSARRWCGPRSAPRTRPRAARSRGSARPGRRGRRTASRHVRPVCPSNPPSCAASRSRRACGDERPAADHAPPRCPGRRTPSATARPPPGRGDGRGHQGADAQAQRQPHDGVELVDVAQRRERGVEGVEPRVRRGPIPPIRRCPR